VRERLREGAARQVESDVDVGDGLISPVKSYGFGPLVPNTVVLGQAATPSCCCSSSSEGGESLVGHASDYATLDRMTKVCPLPRW
jgi:hypothetical protein